MYNQKMYTEGELEVVNGRLTEAVQKGYPEVGWEGDVLLDVRFNRTTEEWQVWDAATGRLAVSKKFNGLRDLDMIPSLCTKLRDASVKKQGVHTVMDRIDAWNDALQRQRDEKGKLILAEAKEDTLRWLHDAGIR